MDNATACSGEQAKAPPDALVSATIGLWETYVNSD